jgi:hypothetical protein
MDLLCNEVLSDRIALYHSFDHVCEHPYSWQELFCILSKQLAAVTEGRVV